MKNIGKVLLVLSVFIFACSSGEDGNTDDGNNGNNNQNDVSSITIMSSDAVLLDNEPEVVIEVYSNKSQKLTSASTIYVDGEILEGNIFFPEEAKAYEIYATYEGLTSKAFNLNVSLISGLKLNISSINIKQNTAHEFIVYDNYDNPLTLPHEIYVNDEKIDGKTFNFDQVSEGNKVYAKYNSDFVGEIVSDELSFDVVNFNKRVLAEDYTGAWCGYCPRLAYRLEEAESLNKKVVPVAIHYNDPMQYSNVNALIERFNVNGFPAGRVNRVDEWDETYNQLDLATGNLADVGLSLNSEIIGNELTVNAGGKFASIFSDKKLIVFLLEDGLISPQANYFNGVSGNPFFGQGNPIPDFVHDNVLRVSLTSDLGDSIEVNDKGEFSFSKTITVPSSYNKSKLEVVAIVVDGSGKSINAKHASVGESSQLD